MKSLATFTRLFACLLLLATSGPARADFHLWFITELYSNADGTVQFIELKAYSSGQQFIAGHTITSTQGSTTRSYTFPTNLPGNSAMTEGGDPYYGGGMTTYKSFLIGTEGFAALNVVRPDYVVPNGFLFTTNGRVVFAEGADTLIYSSLPTDGTLSLKRDGSTSTNSPLNFADESGTIASSSAPASYQGLWLRTPFDSEAGWGLNVTHQGNIVFATWFTYDTDGTGMWLVMSNGAQTSPGNFTGTLYRTRGPGFNASPFTSIAFPDNYTTVGSLTLSFTDANTGTMSYTVNGISQTKPIGRYIYAASGTNCTLGGTQGASPNYQDLWLNSPANTEAGWGMNITHQGDILFATWFTYEAGGTTAAPAKGMWLVMSNGNRTAPGVYSGTLYRTTGPAFSSVPFTPIVFPANYTTVGSVTFTFTGANSGTMAYTVNGVSQTKSIMRYIYATPSTVCR